MRRISTCAALVVTTFAHLAAADTTPQPLPFAQDWTDTGMITANDDWSGVPGITGYRGDDPSTSTGPIDPTTVLVDRSSPVNVLANQTATTNTTGTVAEFQLANPVVGFQGSGNADTPNLVLYLDTTGVATVRVELDVIDLDAGMDVTQQVVVQYRVGASGDFANVAAIADATDAGTGLTTHVDVTLPADAGNVANLQVRIMTGNAQGTDEFVGIDNISVRDASAAPTAIGAADPAAVIAGDAVLLTAVVTPGTVPASTALAVTCDLTAIGGSATQALEDGGASGDVTAGDGTFSVATMVATGTTAGAKLLPCTVTDQVPRSTSFSIALTVDAVCGDGVVEGMETCDDGGTDPGDGCSDACAIETGYDCTGTPSACVDLDECALGTDTCDPNAACANTPGSFTCTCNVGFVLDGTTCAPVCGDGLIVGAEACDDQGTATGDGCDDACAIEAGWSCAGTPSACAPICGDGLRVGAEACDDQDTTAGDGCDDACAVEPGWSCAGTPSVCTEDARCGDGTVDAGEGCDDGNTAGGDGCAAACAVEPGYICTGAPSQCTRDGDGDGVPDADDVCPTVADPAQADQDGDGVGDACEQGGGGATDGDGGGCCSTSGGRGGAGATLLAVLTLGAITRRRRGMRLAP